MRDDKKDDRRVTTRVEVLERIIRDLPCVHPSAGWAGACPSVDPENLSKAWCPTCESRRVAGLL